MSGPPTIAAAILTSTTATNNAKATPAPQLQATFIAIPGASTKATITPRPHTTPVSVSFAGALRQSNRKRSKRRWAAMPTRLTVRIVDAGLPEVVGLVAFCGKYDMLLVAARSLHQDPLMVSLMPLLQRVPAATPGNFPLS